MISKVSEVSSVVPEPSSSAPLAPAPKAAAPEALQPDLRLVIEEDEASGAYVYKTLDRATGEVVRQFPSEALLKLRHEPGYDPGQVVNTRV